MFDINITEAWDNECTWIFAVFLSCFLQNGLRFLLYKFPIYAYGYFRLLSRCSTKETKAIIIRANDGHGGCANRYSLLFSCIMIDELGTEYLIKEENMVISKNRHNKISQNLNVSTTTPITIRYRVSKKAPQVPLRFGCDYFQTNHKMHACLQPLHAFFAGSLSTGTGAVCFIFGNFSAGVATFLLALIECSTLGLLILAAKMTGRSPQRLNMNKRSRIPVEPITDVQKTLFEQMIAQLERKKTQSTDNGVPLKVKTEKVPPQV